MDPISLSLFGTVTSSILGPICGRVIGAAVEEYKSVRDVKEDIKNLKFTVRAIDGVLQDAERKRVENKAVSDWLQELKQILFDAEDVLDEIAADEEALQRTDAGAGICRWPITISMIAEVCNIICSLFSVDNLHSREIAHKIQDIRKRIDFISGEKDKLELGRLTGGISNSSEIRTSRRPETSSLLDNIIARDAEKEEIERLLLSESAEGSDNNNNLHVIVVDGMGGMGKTTLVKYAYNNPTVKQHFEPKMWVCVSNDFDVERITKEIMDVVCTPDELKAFNEILNWSRKQECLQEKLKGKRFLLVLDDLWEISDSCWEILCSPLMRGGKGSKIIVTTRRKEVAHRGARIYLRDLSSEDLWAIFERHAFDNCDPRKRRTLELVGRKIVEKLKGLPLAAKTIGRLLNKNLNLNHWSNVLEAKTWRLSKPGEDNILDVLELSYDYLPGHLKQCFAYCSIFPEDYRFNKDELVRLWMAQQFIEHRVEGNIGGDECFDGLVHASLLEPYIYEDVYVMHDLIQNLTEKVSKGDCFRLEGSGNFKGNSKTIRHVSIATESFDHTKFSELCKFENTRTLLFLRGCSSQLDRHYLDKLFMKLQRLRVLGLRDCKIKELPTSIGTLKHLRYLDLSHNYDISKLLESLCKLLNLQVLKLKRVVIKELPTSIGTLKHLRYLDLSYNCINKLPESLCNLLNLQMLELKNAQIKELPTSIGTLRHLRFLDLSGTRIRKLPESLCELLNLQVLDLRYCRDLGALPENMSALINLRHLYVDDNYHGHKLLVSSIRGLGKLTDLQELYFDCRRQKMREVLADMDMLRLLKISHLEEVESGEEASKSKLDMKEDLEELTLMWGSTYPRMGRTTVINNPELEEEVFQSLKPASNSTCRRLTIEGYGGIRSPDWMDDQLLLSSSCSSLERVALHYCTNWEVLPPLGQLPRLRFLTIRGMDKVRRMGNLFMGGCRGYAEDGGGVLVGVPRGGGGGFPLLEELEFRDMEEWEEWEDDGAEEEDDRLRRQKQPPQQQQQQQPHPPHPQRRQEFLPRLRRLVIENCPKLRQLPPLPPTLRDLEISWMVGLTHLPGWWGSPPSSSTLMSSRSSSPALSSLSIDECPNLTSLPDRLLSRLASLSISSSSVRQMKAWLLQCPPSSLQELKIRDCPQLTGFGGTGDENDDDHDGGDDDDVGGGSGRSAPLLETALLKRLAPTLRRLQFWECRNLRSLPPNLRCLSSLESLGMWYCPQIRSLPAGGLPESLRSLTIHGCPALKDRCRRGEGADWHLISHIDDLDI